MGNLGVYRRISEESVVGISKMFECIIGILGGYLEVYQRSV